jgi:hypothetical protein
MTLTLKRRIRNLPTATAPTHICLIWVRKQGRLACKVCGRP